MLLALVAKGIAWIEKQEDESSPCRLRPAKICKSLKRKRKELTLILSFHMNSFFRDKTSYLIRKTIILNFILNLPGRQISPRRWQRRARNRRTSLRRCSPKEIILYFYLYFNLNKSYKQDFLNYIFFPKAWHFIFEKINYQFSTKLF